jgi:hypothetical protein
MGRLKRNAIWRSMVKMKTGAEEEEIGPEERREWATKFVRRGPGPVS